MSHVLQCRHKTFAEFQYFKMRDVINLDIARYSKPDFILSHDEPTFATETNTQT